MSAEIVPQSLLPPQPQAQAANDSHLLELWLHGRSDHTRRAYRSDVDRFRTLFPKPFAEITLDDLQGFADSLAGLEPASRYRRLFSVKSLLAFGHRIGYLRFDVGRVLRLPPVKNKLAARILSEAELHRMLTLEPDERNRVLLFLLYASGARRAEIAGLAWKDLQATGDSG